MVEVEGVCTYKPIWYFVLFFKLSSSILFLKCMIKHNVVFLYLVQMYISSCWWGVYWWIKWMDKTIQVPLFEVSDHTRVNSYRGTHQSCLFAPVLFTLPLESLAQACIHNPDISKNTNHRMSLYAEDILLFNLISLHYTWIFFSSFKVNICSCDSQKTKQQLNLWQFPQASFKFCSVLLVLHGKFGLQRSKNRQLTWLILPI